MSFLQNKVFRGTVKLFIPYCIQAAYVQRTYGINPAPAWYNHQSFVCRLLYLLIQPLPYGVVADATVRQRIVQPPPTGRGFAVTRIGFAIDEESSLTPELVAGIHHRVLEGLYHRRDASDQTPGAEAEKEVRHE